VKLGAVELVEEIGRGGMAAVWRARHAASGRELAVKLLTSPDLQLSAALLREVRAVARLSHPNIVSIFDVGTMPLGGPVPPGTPYFVMELASGGNARASEQGLSWPTARLVLRAVLDGLAHAHSFGILHLDVKPDNVIVALPDDMRPGIKLTDFGLAHDGGTAGLERSGGTPAYMAPEQLRGEGWLLGPWSDLYAVGCLAFELTTGATPFTGRLDEIMHGHLVKPAPELRSPEALPGEFERWVRRLLEKEPEARFSTAAMAQAALDAIPGSVASFEVAVDELATARGGQPTMTAVSPSAIGSAVTLPGGDALAFVATATSNSGWWREEARRRQPPGLGLGLARLREPVLVGRDEAQAALWDELRACRTEWRPGTAVVTGARGTGRSRLLRWFGARVEEAGVSRNIRIPRAGEPLTGLVAGVRDWLGLDERLAADRDVVERRVRATLAGTGKLDHVVDRVFALLTERPGVQLPLTTLLTLARTAGGLLCTVDDAEGDPALLSLIERSLSEDGPLMWALSVRADEGATLPAAVERLRLRGIAVELEPIPNGQLRNLADGLISLTAEAEAQLLKRAEGNPQHLLDILFGWNERGALVETPRGFDLDRSRLGAAPLSGGWFQEQVVRDLNGETEVAEIAAALGEELDLEEWRAICALAEVGPIEATWQALAGSGALVETPGRVRFAHPSTRAALLELSPPGRWDAIVARGLADRGASSARVARHQLRAGEVEEGISRMLEEARGSLKDMFPLAALLLLDECEEHAASLTESQRLTLLALRARARSRSGIIDLRSLLEELDEAAGSGDDLAQADIMAARGSLLSQCADWEESLKCHESAAVLYTAVGRADLSQRALASAADCVYYLGRRSESGRFYEQALEHARQLEDTDGQARMLWSLAYVERGFGRLDSALAMLEEALALPGVAAAWELPLLVARADVARGRGELVEAERFARRSLEIALIHGSNQVTLMRYNLAAVLMDQGRWEDAAREVEPVLRELERGPDSLWVSAVYAGLIHLAAGRGRKEELEARLRDFERLDSERPRVDEEIAEQLQKAADLVEDRALQLRLRAHVESQRVRIHVAEREAD
jgi:tetratricopeptide (TPR) repeat protein